MPSVRCWGEGTSSKLSVVVEPTMLGSLEQQRQMLEDAAQFLRETFKPVFSSVRSLHYSFLKVILKTILDY